MKAMLARFRDPAGMARLLFRAMLGSGLVRVGNMVLAFVVGVQLARYLGVAEYGVYGAVMSSVAITCAIIGLGIPALASREAAIAAARREWPRLKGIIAWALLVVGGVGCIAWALGAVALALVPGAFPDALRPGIHLAMPLVVTYALVVVSASLLRGAGHLVSGQMLDGLMLPGLFAISLFLAFQLLGDLDAVGALRLHLAAGLATLAAAGLVLGRLVLRTPREDRRLATRGREWLRGALPMGMTEVLRAVDGHFAVLILAAMVAVTDVGLFRVAVSCAVFVSLPYSLFGMIALPVAARLAAEKNQRGLQMFASAVAVVATGAIACILLVLWFFGEDLIVIVFGSEYAGAWSILMVLGLAGLLAASTGVSAGVLNATGNERAVTRAYAVSVVVGIASIVVLVPLMGVAGAAWALVLSAATRSVMLYRDTTSRAGIDPTVLSGGTLLGTGAVQP